MILRGAQKPTPFLSAIASTIARESIVLEAEDLTPEDRIVYFGADYWRGRLSWDADGRIEGVTLENSDRTFHERRAVEVGIAILIHCSYC